MTTRQQISDWYDQGVTLDATHMLVVTDTFDYDDYPVYVRIDPTVKADERQGRVIVVKDIDGLHALIALRFDKVNMQKLTECYNLSKGKQEQLSEVRAFNY